METACEYYIVSVDRYGIHRLLPETSNDDVALLERADSYWDTEADEGETVLVACKHHPYVQRVLPSN